MKDDVKSAPDSLITERDIDPEYGLFSEEAQTDHIPTAEQELEDMYPAPEQSNRNASTPIEEDTGLESVPDADDISQNSPVDPAAPPDIFHGTDLINGVGNDPEEETDAD
jgi:hypothetical protein